MNANYISLCPENSMELLRLAKHSLYIDNLVQKTEWKGIIVLQTNI